MKDDWVIELLHLTTFEFPKWVVVGTSAWSFEQAVDVVGQTIEAHVPADHLRIRNTTTNETLMVGCIL